MCPYPVKPAQQTLDCGDPAATGPLSKAEIPQPRDGLQMQGEPLANPRFEHQQFRPLSMTAPDRAASMHLIGTIQKERAIPDDLPEKIFRVQVSRECNALDRLRS